MIRLFALSLLLAAPARAAFEVPGFELVYSYPVETSLEEKDLRLAQDVWPAMFDAAVKTIDIEQFYVTPSTGEPLEQSLQALERAAARGVKIRVILEQKFEKNSLDGIARLKSIPGLELRVLDWSKVNGDGIIHAKFFVVDSTQAFVGSQNFDWRALKHIHELGLRITDASIVRNVQRVFDHDWALTEDPGNINLDEQRTPGGDRSGRAYLVASPWRRNPNGVGDSESELAALIGEAKTELIIQLLDYNPTTYARPKRFYFPIDNALRDAAVRGVKIKLLVSHWNTDEHSVAHLKSLALVPGVEIKVLTVPAAKRGYIPFARVIHSKYMVADGKTAWLGTSNWAGGYLDTSRNLELVVKDEALAFRAAKIHARLWGSAYAEPLDILKAYPKPKK
ncbi:MAG: phospholipase D-like domain-containing protein [Elusimicrobia bacterium]|nr:phospholipase D-like domain-containing protein [Elusimicrobiota bacterium]